jgi:predicted kinase
MLILMAGLPGTGKSALARELAAQTSGIVLGKDEIRSVLFPSSEIEYSAQQDDFCQQVMLETAAYLLRKDTQRFIFLDGRTFSRRYQIDRALDCAASLGQPWRILECVCSDITARQRLEEQARTATHPAGNRDYALYREVKAHFEAITLPKTVIDTEQPLETCIQFGLKALASE